MTNNLKENRNMMSAITVKEVKPFDCIDYVLNILEIYWYLRYLVVSPRVAKTAVIAPINAHPKNGVSVR